MLTEALTYLEAGERATFSFAADAARLPLGGGGGAGGADGGGGGGAMLPLGAEVRPGELVELEVELVHCLRQRDVGRARDGTAFKCKMAVGSGFWKPRELYRVTISAAAAPASVSPSDGKRPPPRLGTYELQLGDEGVATALQDVVATMSLNEVALLTAPRAALAGRWPAGGALHDAMPPAGADGRVTLWLRVDAITRVEGYGEGAKVRKRTLNGAADLGWLERAFVDGKGELPMLEEDVLMVMGCAAADGKGTPLFAADRQLRWRVGDLPLADDWVLMMLMTMYQGERATISAAGADAAYLFRAFCALRREHGGCAVDADAGAAHVAAHGLELTLAILEQAPPEPRDGVSAPALLAAAASLKARANALLNAGHVSAAMRKYVRATWLLQDGDAAYDPALPMAEVVGVGRGDEPRRTRFGAPALRAQADELRLSLHMNLASGAL